jgi:hypothetical protein
VEETYSLSLVNVNAFDGALRHISCRSSSSKPRERHSLLKEKLGFAFRIVTKGK